MRRLLKWLLDRLPLELLLSSAGVVVSVAVAVTPRSTAQAARASLSGPEPEGSPAASRHLPKLTNEALLEIGRGATAR